MTNPNANQRRVVFYIGDAFRKFTLVLIHGDMTIASIKMKIDWEILTREPAAVAKQWQLLNDTQFMNVGNKYINELDTINQIRGDRTDVIIRFTETPPTQWEETYKFQHCRHCDLKWYGKKERTHAYCPRCFVKDYLKPNPENMLRLDLHYRQILCIYCHEKAELVRELGFICMKCWNKQIGKRGFLN